MPIQSNCKGLGLLYVNDEYISRGMKMDRRKFLKAVAAGTAVCLAGCLEEKAVVQNGGKMPNVIVFYVDDLGYADVGYHGCKDIPTPNIDSIAENGAQFSAAYVTAPICGPSRAGLLTGRYQQRFGFETNPSPWAYLRTADTRAGIPLEEKTIGERMREIGYKTAFIGKVHSGQQPEHNPYNRGFDLFFGFDNGASEYFFHEYKQRTAERLKRNLETARQEDQYYTDAFGREALSFIDVNKSRSFFIYLPFNAPHGPMQAPDELMEKFSYIKDEGRRVLAAMMYAVDNNIGKVLKRLREYDLEENTLIIFTSDNGGASHKSNFSLNHPCRDLKGTMYDGGVRVPFCMQWKSKIAAGKKYEFPISTLDIMPTAIASSGSKIKGDWQLDGINLLPYLSGGSNEPELRYLYWRLIHSWAIRDNEWKLVKARKGGKPELYHIQNDIGEKKNLISKYPNVAARLKKVWQKWSDSLMEPQWGPKEICGDKYKMKINVE